MYILNDRRDKNSGFDRHYRKGEPDGKKKEKEKIYEKLRVGCCVY